jgi:hypothetical protein
MSTSSDSFLASVIAAPFVMLGVFILWFIGSLIRGFVLLKMWAWFLIPLGLPTITLWHAVGVSMIVAYLAQANLGIYKEHELDNGKAIFHGIISPWILLFFAWVIHLLMG